MGNFDGAEICKLVGIYILSLLSNKLDKQSSGLYRDDGLALHLSNNSSNKQVFDMPKGEYEKALRESHKNVKFIQIKRT